ncbi:amidohydrolase [Abyssisolibacter fermentans]|uniref:amidohydrolase n=1 Tax=Abyssisolibacter fermentans TaxID=1766203 RepID=UPI00082C9234|nr:amidohydrolase [Abyssisolibacter fermentans]
MEAYINGNIITMNSDLQNANYFIVEDGCFSEVGNDFELSSFDGEIIDLKGKTVLPGFTDSHMHILSYATKKEFQVDLTKVRSLEQLADVTKEFVKKKKLKKGDWVVGVGWNHEYFEDCKLPDRKLLDEISAELPIILIRACYHICVVNTKALDLAGLLSETKEVNGGQIDRDGQGNPTGILRENACELVEGLIPTINDIKTVKELLISGLNDAASVGLTTVCIDDFSYVEDKEMLLRAYKELEKDDKLPINIILQLRTESVEDIHTYKRLGLKSWQKGKRIVVGPIKIIGDGSLGSSTAALNEPYENEGDNRGILVETEDKLDKMINESFNNDFDIAIHAIGDRAMQVILDSYKRYQNIIKEKKFTPSIIHCQIANEKVIQDMKAMNIIANIQPIFVCTDWRIVRKRVGKLREKYSYCWNTFLKNEILCVGGSDAPIESFNPLYGIYSAVTRKDMESKPEGGWCTEEAVSIKEAVKMFTINTAYATHQEQERGSIQKGKNADFVILDKDIENIYDDFNGCRVIRSYVAGKQVYTKI